MRSGSVIFVVFLHFIDFHKASKWYNWQRSYYRAINSQFLKIAATLAKIWTWRESTICEVPTTAILHIFYITCTAHIASKIDHGKSKGIQLIIEINVEIGNWISFHFSPQCLQWHEEFVCPACRQQIKSFVWYKQQTAPVCLLYFLFST